MTSVNETNAITEYKKRLVEKVKKLKDDATLMNSYNRKRAGWKNRTLDDVLDLINSTN